MLTGYEYSVSGVFEFETSRRNSKHAIAGLCMPKVCRKSEIEVKFHRMCIAIRSREINLSNDLSREKPLQ